MRARTRCNLAREWKMNTQNRQDDVPTMFSDVIRALHGANDTQRPARSDVQLYNAAIMIRDAWPRLEKIDQMVVDTLLAWAVTYAGNTPALFAHSQARVNSPFSLRNPIVRNSPDTIEGVAALITQVIADAARAQNAAESGEAHETLQALLKEMQAKYPALGLTFGYVGNCDLGSMRWDDRSWKYFTKCATPACTYGCDVSFGGVGTSQLGRLMIQAEQQLDDWCAEQQRRLDAGEIRRVGN